MAQVDFSILGNLANDFREAQMQRNRRTTLAELGKGGPVDYNTLATKLMAAGDPMGLTLANLANNQRDFQFRQQEATRAQTNADRSFGLQKEQSDAAARGYDYRELDDGQGGKTLVRINKQTGQTERVPIAGHDTTPQNPYVTGKMNESQSKDALYSSRMIASEQILRDPSVVGAATSLSQRAMGAIPVAGNFMVSEAYQKFDQAQRDFINATLRRESGAVISEQEFDNARKQYFPQPGDTEQRLMQKQRNRAEAIRGIAAGAGPGYRPDKVLTPDGQIVANPAQGRAQQPAAQPQAQPGQAKVTVPVMPKVGEVRDGYRYKGGNPAMQSSWEKQ